MLDIVRRGDVQICERTLLEGYPKVLQEFEGIQILAVGVCDLITWVVSGKCWECDVVLRY